MRDLVTAENKWVSQSRNRVGSPFVLKDLHLNLQEFKLLSSSFHLRATCATGAKNV